MSALPGIADAASVQRDFNGDGFADLAVGVPGKTVAGTPSWGAVHVIYGSRHGLSPKGDAVIKIELPGTSEFGIALAEGDFNGDGRSDLAVGAPFSTFAGQSGAGYVAVIYGTKHGLPLHSAQLVAQGQQGMVGSPDPFDIFGVSLAAANFGRGKADDLAIGASGENGAAGEVDVLYGSPTGLRGGGSEAFSRATAGVPGDPSVNERFGFSLAAGNLGHSRTADLAVGIPSATVDAVSAAGAAVVLFAGPNGLRGAGAREFTAATPGVPGDPQDNGQLGRAVAIGDFGRGGVGDLAIGAPFATRGTLNHAGEVTVLYGGKHGPGTKHADLLRLGINGMAGPAVDNDALGRELVAGDAGAGGRADLVMSSERAVAGASEAGAIAIAYGSKRGLTGKGSQVIDRSTPGVAGAPGENDVFGTSMRIGAFDGPASHAVAVGVPGADAGTVQSAGAVNLLRATRHGLRGAGLLIEGADGLAGTAQTNNAFGASLSHRSSVGLFD